MTKTKELNYDPDNIMTFFELKELADVKKGSKLHKRLTALFKSRETENWGSYIAQAEKEHGREGETEIDSNANVSLSDGGGAYVSGWLWVYNPVCSVCDNHAVELRDSTDKELICDTCKKEEE